MTASRDSDESSTITIHTSSLYSPATKSFQSNLTVTVNPNTGLIASVTQRSDSSIPSNTNTTSQSTSPTNKTYDLRSYTTLPGLVDAHTHILLTPYSVIPSQYQITSQSPIDRVVRATAHLRAALLAGYTTYRDLGSEGLGRLDAHLRDAVNRSLTPGPRLFVATDPLASSGGYESRVETDLGGSLTSGNAVPTMADVCDGVSGVRAGVRRRLAAGADLVKVYSDYRRRALRWPAESYPGCAHMAFAPSGDLLSGTRNPNLPMWTDEEMGEIVREAERGDADVAAHCMLDESVVQACRAGVRSVEHAALMGEEAMGEMVRTKTIWVPTLSVFELFGSQEVVTRCLANVKRGWEMGVRIATGGDTGAFAHGDNVRELELLFEAGIPVEEVLFMATEMGWEACGGTKGRAGGDGRKFGRIEEGYAADMIALEGDPTENFGTLRKVVFVMKDGVIYKEDGKGVNMY